MRYFKVKESFICHPAGNESMEFKKNSIYSIKDICNLFGFKPTNFTRSRIYKLHFIDNINEKENINS